MSMCVRLTAPLRGQRPRELVARPDAELPIDVPQVVLDRLRAEEEPRGGLARRAPAREEQRDLELLRCQVSEGAGGAAPRRLAGGGELRARKLGPRRGSEPLEELQPAPKLLPRVHTPAR